MDLRWRRAPWWLLAVVGTVAVYAVWARLALLGLAGGRAAALTQFALPAVAFGVVGSFRQRSRNLHVLALVGEHGGDRQRYRRGAAAEPLELGEQEKAAALRAARTGPLPQDPRVLTAAVRLADDRQERARSKRLVDVIVGRLAMVVLVILALVATPRWWSVLALAVLVAFSRAWYEHRMRRRAEALRAAADVRVADQRVQPSRDGI